MGIFDLFGGAAQPAPQTGLLGDLPPAPSPWQYTLAGAGQALQPLMGATDRPVSFGQTMAALGGGLMAGQAQARDAALKQGYLQAEIRNLGLEGTGKDLSNQLSQMDVDYFKQRQAGLKAGPYAGGLVSPGPVSAPVGGLVGTGPAIPSSAPAAPNGNAAPTTPVSTSALASDAPGGGKSIALTPDDKEALIRTSIAEAGNQGPDGIAAVQRVVLNRAAHPGWGGSVQDVVTAKNQFEPVSKAGGDWHNLPAGTPEQRAIAEQALTGISGGAEDPTKGATYFQNQAITNQRGTNFAQGVDPTVNIGAHSFYGPDALGGAQAGLPVPRYTVALPGQSAPAAQQPRIQVASNGPTAGLLGGATAPQGGPQTPAPPGTTPVQGGGFTSPPLINLAQMIGGTAGIQAMQSSPAGAKMLASILPLYEKLVPQGMELGQDGVLRPMAGAVNSTYQLKYAEGAGTSQGQLPADITKQNNQARNEIQVNLNKPYESRPGNQLVIPSMALSGAPGGGVIATNSTEVNDTNKGLADQNIQVMNAAQAAKQRNSSLDQITAQLGDINSGKLGDVVGAGKNYLSSVMTTLGYKPNESVTADQVFDKLTTQMFGDATKALDQTSYAALQQMKNAFPNRAMTIDALKEMVGSLHGLNDYQIELDRARSEYRTGHNGSSDGFNTSDWHKANQPLAYALPYMPADQVKKLLPMLPTAVAARAKELYLQMQTQRGQ